MDSIALASISRQFANIGARLVTESVARVGGRFALDPRPYDLDIRRDRNGEHFRLLVTPAAPALRVLHTLRDVRHLLLHAAGVEGGERFLCGHDERHWFVAAISARVTSVTEAKRALLPAALRDLSIVPELLARRHNDVFKRQGEWFFIPTDRDLSKYPIHRQEPLVRGRTGKPHLCAEIVRFGGTPVYLMGQEELTPEEYAMLPPKKQGRARYMVKDPETYARGAVWHADHATLILRGWHRVYPNSEARSVNLSFYD